MKAAESATAAAVTFGILFGVFALILVVVLVIMFCKPKIFNLQPIAKDDKKQQNASKDKS